MKRAAITLTLIVALASVGWAQDLPNPQASIAVETRLTLLESRLARVEADVSRLSGVPLSLARIEERLENLTEKAGDWGGNVSTVVIAVLTMVMGSVTGAAWQAKRGGK